MLNVKNLKRGKCDLPTRREWDDVNGLGTSASVSPGVKNVAFAFIYKCVMIPLNIYLLVATWDRLVGLGAV